MLLGARHDFMEEQNSEMGRAERHLEDYLIQFSSFIHKEKEDQRRKVANPKGQQLVLHSGPLALGSFYYMV